MVEKVIEFGIAERFTVKKCEQKQLLWKKRSHCSKILGITVAAQ
jgi:hypothetical protein